MNKTNNLKLFIYAIALSGLAIGFSDSLLANYFKDVYHINAFQRGFIEFPRELPGVLGVVVISGLISWGDIKIAILSFFLSAVGIIVLGFWTPSFNIMLVLLFVFSLGMHILMPLQDSITLSLVDKEFAGKALGEVRSKKLIFTIIASLIVFFGFKDGWLSFNSPIILFIIAGIIYFISAFLLLPLVNNVKSSDQLPTFKFVIRKEYMLYYLLTILNGAQKQIMIVFAPWLMIELLKQGPATIAIVTLSSSLVSVFFLPTVGRWIDKFGIKRMMYMDALSFVFVYLLYGLLTSAIVAGSFDGVFIPLILASVMFVLDRLSMNLGLVRTIYLQKIAFNKSEITQTLAFGVSLDHIVAIVCATISGAIWINFGPQYVFYFAGGLSIFNVIIAYLVKE